MMQNYLKFRISYFDYSHVTQCLSLYTFTHLKVQSLKCIYLPLYSISKISTETRHKKRFIDVDFNELFFIAAQMGLFLPRTEQIANSPLSSK